MPKIKEIITKVWECNYCEDTFHTQEAAAKHEAHHACEHLERVILFTPGWTNTEDESGTAEPACGNCLIPMGPVHNVPMNVYEREHQVLLMRLYEQTAEAKAATEVEAGTATEPITPVTAERSDE